MLGTGWSNVWVYDRYVPNSPFIPHLFTIILMGIGRCILYILLNLLFHLDRYYSTFGGSMRFSFYGNLNDYYYEFHGIRNSFHDHVLVHVQGFRTISLSLQRMVQIQLDGTCDFSSNAYYFAQPQEDMVLI